MGDKKDINIADLEKEIELYMDDIEYYSCILSDCRLEIIFPFCKLWLIIRQVISDEQARGKNSLELVSHIPTDVDI
ncbi:hypothetical protein NQ317_003205 [Molorchus minor]|uniref:Uncharacterized protein n=1 Tax=Molorchus minor TaxID=1323400 RepID=A0ABQ9J7J4_9CUCU|nr:hypothetical protein NQ317_003205 [Molorchus minor]